VECPARWAYQFQHLLSQELAQKEVNQATWCLTAPASKSSVGNWTLYIGSCCSCSATIMPCLFWMWLSLWCSCYSPRSESVQTLGYIRTSLWLSFAMWINECNQHPTWLQIASHFAAFFQAVATKSRVHASIFKRSHHHGWLGHEVALHHLDQKILFRQGPPSDTVSSNTKAQCKKANMGSIDIHWYGSMRWGSLMLMVGFGWILFGIAAT
jgi:hypothetical protein